jgi:hypothetical protein
MYLLLAAKSVASAGTPALTHAEKITEEIKQKRNFPIINMNDRH